MTTDTDSVVAIEQEFGDHFGLYHADCCEAVRGIPDESIHYVCYSVPFASLYTYSASNRDLGNCTDYAEFCEHYDFLIRELYRVTKPGRLTSVHCMNLPASKTHDGYIGLKDFRGDIIRAHIDDEAADFHRSTQRLQKRLLEAMREHDVPRVSRLDSILFKMQEELISHSAKSGGWIYHSEVVIWKDPVTAMQRTKAIGLLHKQIVKDSCMSRMGIPDYVVTFRKPGVNPEPVEGELDRFAGDKSTFKSEGRLSIDIWQRYASPVWMDINPSDTLQKNSARDEADERHICPLQLDVIERCLQLWSNPGDTILSPFAGIGSEIYQAILMGRKGIGIELKESYFKQAVANCRIAEEKCKEGRLF